jgi:hypothetical protein
VQTTRTWNDSLYPAGDPRNGNYVPDCDLNSRVLNGECGAMDNRNFGTSVFSNTIDPEILSGWGVRPSDWQLGVSVQHEVLPRVSVEVASSTRVLRLRGDG